MKLIIKDILERTGHINDVDDLSDKLIQLGHEHEIDKDIIDLELTPNRGDCFSLKGILRDLNSLSETNSDFEIFNEELDRLDFKFKNNLKDACPVISFLEIEIESIPDIYHDYMDNYFDKLNQKKINFFTDVSNYLSYEIGQPTHCYDRSKIDNSIELDIIQDSSKFITLTDKELTLSNDLAFISNNRVVNLAGVMGGKFSSCSNNTKKILLECAYFDPKYIIGKNLKFDLNSDAAHKFERGTDPSIHDYAIRRFIRIVQDHTKVNSLKHIKFASKEFKPKKIKKNVDKLNKILGTNISEDQYNNYLHSLGFRIFDDEISPPEYRHDINYENDIAEEIARVIGYDNISRSEIKIQNKTDFKKNKEDVIREYLTDNGFYEVINFPFVKENTSNSILIDNPLDSNKKYMRTSLQKCLENNLSFNERRQKDSIKLFEISDIYRYENKIIKDKKIGIIATGRLGHNFKDFSKRIDKNYFEGVLSFFRDHNKNNPFLFTEISRDLINSKSKDKIFFVEFNISDLADISYVQKNKKPTSFVKYKKISEYPSITRDLSFALEDPSKYYELQELLLNYQNKYLKTVFIFDFFNNKDQAKLKIGFRFIFQSVEKTLSDSDIDDIMNDIINQSLEINSVMIPGLK